MLQMVSFPTLYATFASFQTVVSLIWKTLTGIEFDSLHFEGSQKFIRLPRLLDVLKNCETAVYEAAGVFENHRFSQTLGGVLFLLLLDTRVLYVF